MLVFYFSVKLAGRRRLLPLKNLRDSISREHTKVSLWLLVYIHVRLLFWPSAQHQLLKSTVLTYISVQIFQIILFYFHTHIEHYLNFYITNDHGTFMIQNSLCMEILLNAEIHDTLAFCNWIALKNISVTALLFIPFSLDGV